MSTPPGASAPGPGPAPPAATPATPAAAARRLSFGRQVAIGFFGPGVLAFALWLVALAAGREAKGLAARGAIDVLCVLATLGLWFALFRLSARAAWKGVRLGLFLLVGAAVLWIAGCFALAHRLLHG